MSKVRVAKIAKWVLVFGAMVGSQPAFAKQTGCDCGGTPLSLEKAVDEAVLVFSGKVERLTWKRPSNIVNEIDLGGGKKVVTVDGGDPDAPEEAFKPKEIKSQVQYFVHFRVRNGWKGEPLAQGSDVAIQTTNTVARCWFEEGKEYLVFAKAHGPYRPIANLCGRTRLLDEAQSDVDELKKEGRDK
jgi:hypothetical protein